MPGVKSKIAQHFKTAENTRVSVDISCGLYFSLTKPKNDLAAYSMPSCPATDDTITRRHPWHV